MSHKRKPAIPLLPPLDSATTDAAGLARERAVLEGIFRSTRSGRKKKFARPRSVKPKCIGTEPIPDSPHTGGLFSPSE